MGFNLSRDTVYDVDTDAGSVIAFPTPMAEVCGEVSLLNPGQDTPYPAKHVLQIGVRDEAHSNVIQHWDQIVR